VRGLDRGAAGDRRRRELPPLAPGERALANLDERDRGSLLVDVDRPSVDFVHERVLRRHRSKSDGGIRAGDDEVPSGECFLEHGIRGVA
jgi:hypothetical protein